MSNIMQSQSTDQKQDQPKSKGRYEEKTNRRAASYQTERTRREPFCYFCNGNDKEHYTRDFRKLAEKSLKERKDFVHRKGLCFFCVNGKHRSSICNHKQACSKCQRMHPTMLHDPDWKPTEKSDSQRNSSQQPTTSNQDKEQTKTKTCNSTGVYGQSSFSMMVPVYVSAGNNEKLVYALLDTLSDITFIDKQTAMEIGASGIPDTLNLETMNAISRSSTLRYEKLQIRGYLTDEISTIDAVERPEIKCHSDNIPTDEKCRKIPHLRSLARHLPPKLDIPIGLMIGKDSPEIITPLLTKRGEAGETSACKTMFGWTLCGGKLKTKLATSFKTDATLFPIVEQDFEDPGGKPLSQQDMQFLKILDEGIHQDPDGSYVMPLPFKSSSTPILPNNRHQAEQRLGLLKNKLLKDSAYEADYRKFMNTLFEKGFAEEVPVSEMVREDGKCWYIPHFGVLHPKKRKLRVVFDGSAKYANTCLNHHLLTGPDQLNDLLGILCRFRTGKVAVTCDVESMFYNFRVSQNHRNFLRFVWYSDDLSTVKTFRMRVHIFGATSSPGVATFGLRRLAEDNIEISKSAAEFLKDNFYVDDGIFSVDDIQTAKDLVNSAREICSKGNLRLHKYVSNEPAALADLPESEKETEAISFNSIMPTQRTLGVSWCLQSDQLCFTSNIDARPLSRRGILSTVAQVYDPIGLVSPFTLKGKNVLQDVCRKGLDWDEQIDLDTTSSWEAWTRQLATIHDIRVDRCIKPKDFGTIKRAELHHFADASEDGYGACSYIRLIDTTDRIHCALVLSKARVAPLNRTTIPRMELQGAVLATKLQGKLHEELRMPIDGVFFWTDSMIVLGYIRNETSRFSPFVANRATQIRHRTKPAQWNHVPGIVNPADMASRGATIHQLTNSHWFSGPDFLWKENLDDILLNQPTRFNVPASDPELRKTIRVDMNQVTYPIKVENFSKWDNLIRATAQLRAVAKRAKDKLKPIWKLEKMSREHSQDAEALLIRLDQQKYFHSEILDIQAHGKVSKGSCLRQLSPYLDDLGILRIGSRAKSSTILTDKELRPAIIHKRSHLATVLIRHFHEKVHHQGRIFTQSAIRQSGFYIIGAQGLIKLLLRTCVGCKRLRGAPLRQQMGSLPKERVEHSPPFTHVGVDTFGHFLVKEGRKEMKRWCIIFTCMYSRAIHIEVVSDLSTESFLQALRCLESIRGPVVTIFSDNGTNYMGSKTMLQSRITFKTNTPGASHQGGVWERGIRMIRNVFNQMKGRFSARLDPAGLRTAMYEICSIINGKPLTCSNLNNPDEGVITPHHLITMKPVSVPTHQEIGEVPDGEVYGKNMFEKTQRFADEFWRHWQDYLTKVETRQKWRNPCQNLKVGDVVAVVDENTWRSQWKVGAVDSVNTGRDGLVRSATVRISNPEQITRSGKRKGEPNMLYRPIQKLLLLVSINSKY